MTKKAIGIMPPPTHTPEVLAIMDAFSAEIAAAEQYIGSHPMRFHAWLMLQCRLNMHKIEEAYASALEKLDTDLVTVLSKERDAEIKRLQSLNSQRLTYHAAMNKPGPGNRPHSDGGWLDDDMDDAGNSRPRATS